MPTNCDSVLDTTSSTMSSSESSGGADMPTLVKRGQVVTAVTERIVTNSKEPDSHTHTNTRFDF